MAGLYPTQTKTAYETLVERTAAATYDFYTGLPLISTDVDNNINNATEYDAVGRPVKTITGQGTALESWVQTEYNAEARRVIVRADLETKGDGRKVATQFYDQLGRVRLTKTLEDAATQSASNELDGIKVQTRYLYHNPSPFSSNGAYTLTSNPYRAATSSAATAETTMGWTLGYSDKLGKHSETVSFSGTGLPAPWGSNTSSTGAAKTDIAADRTLVTDQAGKQRISKINVFGLLTDVWEITAQDSATTGITFPNHGEVAYGYQTTYSYDTLGNLLLVNQGSQTRSFVYNSLARLTSAQSPELGTTPTNGIINYVYDANGNLTQKTDPRGVATAYTYDALNRVTQRSYSGESGYTTPTVSYFYDDKSHAKGKLTKVSSSVSATEFTSFDLLGRVTVHKQTTAARDFETSYIYNLSGTLIEETYPSGRKVKNTFENNGDLSQVQSKKNPTSGYWTYANSFSYDAAGMVTSMQLGNGHWESSQFNARLQPVQIALGVTPGDSSLLKLAYSYGTTQNNGNIQSQTITVPAAGGSAAFTAAQNYSYDQLNRLYDAAETISGSQSWKQTFSYDRFGNRRFDTGSNRTTTLEANCAAAICNPEINQTNNRLVGTTFDSAGNTTVAGDSQQYLYDGENKMVQAKDGAGAVLGAYYYDGDGKRVKKYVPNTGETTIFVYDVSGKTVAEYSTNLSSDPQVAYLTSDSLGTPRINTNAGGAVIARHDYHPFGEEISTSQRTPGTGYDSDDIRKKFTGYERDDETELDYAQNRYYQKSQGRFTSPDPTILSVKAITPQTWNRYIYVLNNPYLYTDPLGLWTLVVTPVPGKDKKGRDIIRNVITVVKDNEGEEDTPEHLANQLGLKGEERKEFLAQIGNKNEIRLSELEGKVGDTFTFIEGKLDKQSKWNADNKDKIEELKKQGKTGPGDGNCAGTASFLAFGVRGEPNKGPEQMDAEMRDNPLNLRNVPQEEAQFLDIVRYADKSNNATHFVNFIFKTEDKVPMVFSKSGNTGPYQVGSAASFQTPTYGTVRGRALDKSGYYRPH